MAKEKAKKKQRKKKGGNKPLGRQHARRAVVKSTPVAVSTRRFFYWSSGRRGSPLRPSKYKSFPNFSFQFLRNVDFYSKKAMILTWEKSRFRTGFNSFYQVIKKDE